jgi:thiol-disulfide isomerase/thioredoxin
MRKFVTIISFCLLFCSSCESPTQFTEESVQEVFLDLNENKIVFKDIIKQYKGEKVLIDVWASWCADCIVGLPNLKAFQKEHPHVKYLFLSLDNTAQRWKKAIDQYQIKGDHYFMKEGKKGPLGDFLNLWWIPRYVVVNEQGDIALFKATKITDKNIAEALNPNYAE